MDLVGPSHVQSVGGKWYVLVVVGDYSRYEWVFFLEEKGDTFGFVRDLVLRLRNEKHGDAMRAIRNDNGSEFKNSHFETFCHDFGLEHQCGGKEKQYLVRNSSDDARRAYDSKKVLG
jgi:transposase InsO family protein